MRERLRGATAGIRKRGADYLAYALIDSVVDSYFHILEKVGDHLAQLEEDLLDQPGTATLGRIHHFKRELHHSAQGRLAAARSDRWARARRSRR